MFESGAGAPQVVDLRGATAALATVQGSSDTDRIDKIAALESLKAAAAAAQARLTVEFADSQEAAQAAAGVPARDRGRGVAAQIALARRESPHRGSRYVGLARAMVHEMPATMTQLSAGRVSEWRATILCRETAVLSVDDRREVDRRLGRDLPSMGDAQVTRAARGLAARLDPASVARRAGKAAAERCVSLRAAPDTMTYLTGLLPVAQGVATYAALDRHATALITAGDERARGQIMADTLVERVTGQTTADAVPVEVNLVVPFDALTDDDAVCEMVGGGPIAAESARELLAAAADSDAAVWFRQLVATVPDGQLLAMESRRRAFPAGLRRFLVLRDGTCRTPWCDAPIRHADHVVPAAHGGPTNAANGQGLCAACNQAKEAPGWRSEVIADGLDAAAAVGRHRVRLRTPTGHTYDSTAPPLLFQADRPAAQAPSPDFSALEWAYQLDLNAA